MLNMYFLVWTSWGGFFSFLFFFQGIIQSCLPNSMEVRVVEQLPRGPSNTLVTLRMRGLRSPSLPTSKKLEAKSLILS